MLLTHLNYCLVLIIILQFGYTNIMDEPSLILDIVPDLQLMPYQQLVNFLEPPLR